MPCLLQPRLAREFGISRETLYQLVRAFAEFERARLRKHTQAGVDAARDDDPRSTATP